MKNNLLRVVFTLLVALAGCTLEPEPVGVTFTGTVTENGTPVQGAIADILRPGANGLPEVVGTMTTGSDGGYSLTTSIQAIRCFLIVIEVEVLDGSGARLYFGRENAQSCGTNVQDFEFP